MTIAELLDFPGSDGVKTVLLSFLQRTEFPLTDWEPGGTIRTLTELETATVVDLLDAIAFQVAGGFLDSSEDDWLTALAHGWYEIDRVPPAIARQVVTLACDAAHGPYAITPMNVLGATDGARYFSATTGTLASGSTLEIEAIAESPRAARGLINTTVTPLPGVTVTAAAIEIISGVSQYGADEEKDASVAKRCDARWPELDQSVDAPDRVVKWALASDVEITRTRLDSDSANPGGVIVTVAGPSGAVTSGAVIAAQAYIDERAPITDYITTQNASNFAITAGGTVTVPVGLETQIKAAADAAWSVYLSVAQIGGQVYLSELVQAVMDAGAIDFTEETLNTVPDNVALASNQVPIPNPSGLATLLTWATV